jgi:hypothetical protein
MIQGTTGTVFTYLRLFDVVKGCKEFYVSDQLTERQYQREWQPEAFFRMGKQQKQNPALKCVALIEFYIYKKLHLTTSVYAQKQNKLFWYGTVPPILPTRCYFCSVGGSGPFWIISRSGSDQRGLTGSGSNLINYSGIYQPNCSSSISTFSESGYGSVKYGYGSKVLDP